jgi:uncharacterized protein (DUF1778 family)
MKRGRPFADRKREVRLHIVLFKDEADLLDISANSLNQTRSEFIRAAIRRHIAATRGE